MFRDPLAGYHPEILAVPPPPRALPVVLLPRVVSTRLGPRWLVFFARCSLTPTDRRFAMYLVV